MPDHDNFRELVGSDPILQAAFHTFTDKIISDVKAEYGVDVDKAALAALHSVKVATLSGDESLGDTWKQELINSNADVQQAIKTKELTAAFADEDHAKHEQVHEDWNRLSIHQRMAKARQMDAAKTKTASKPSLTEAQRAKAISDISNLRGGAKIAAARAAVQDR